MAGATSRRTVIAGIAAVLFGGRFSRVSAQTPGTCTSDDDCGLCEFCQNPGASGACAFVPYLQDPNNDCPDTNYCSGNGVCSCSGPESTCTVDAACCGGGNCINGQCCIRNGFGSAVASYCCSGIIADNVCCDTACEGVCNSCGVQGGTGMCTDVNANCSDGNNCTDDICTAGVCSSIPKDCSDLDEVCKGGLCDAQTGNCIAVNHDDGFVCGTNAVCSNGVCSCATGFVSCGAGCVAGNCCEDSNCTMDAEVGDDTCAAMICINNFCQLITGDESCGACEQCDPESLECVDTCDHDECCCDDHESCSADCCPDLCKRDKDCPKGQCCCKDGSCDEKCCGGGHKTTPPPPPPSTGKSDPVVSTLPSTGTGSTADGRGAVVGMAVAGGLAAWAATKMRPKNQVEVVESERNQ